MGAAYQGTAWHSAVLVWDEAVRTCKNAHKHGTAWQVTAQHGAVQHSMAQHSMIQHGRVQLSTAQHDMVLHDQAQHSISA